jgi:hypothetical protein
MELSIEVLNLAYALIEILQVGLPHPLATSISAVGIDRRFRSKDVSACLDVRTRWRRRSHIAVKLPIEVLDLAYALIEILQRRRRCRLTISVLAGGG